MRFKMEERLFVARTRSLSPSLSETSVDTLRESLLTAGDTSQFFGDKFVEKTNLQVHGMQSRTVRVADATKSITIGCGML